MSAVAVSARGVSVRLGGRVVLQDVDLDLVQGEVLALIGPNGAGKSTLLHALAGDVPTSAGSVHIASTAGARAVGAVPASELARLRSVLTQDNAVSFPFLVREVIEMGRAPWARHSDDEADAAAVARAIERTDVAHLLDRPFTALSGGERARASLARVLAQNTPVVLLDEPTAALDLRHQEEVMRVAHDLAIGGAAVAIVLHDLGLAGAWAQRIALLDNGRLERVGSPTEVLEATLLSRVYGLAVEVHDVGGRRVVVPTRVQSAGA